MNLFSDLARAYSDDTMSAADGGSLDWAARGTFVPEFDDKIDNLPLNKLVSHSQVSLVGI